MRDHNTRKQDFAVLSPDKDEHDTSILENLTADTATILLQSMDDLVFLLDKDRNIKTCFQQECEDLYIPPSFFLGKNIKDIPLPEDVIELLQHAFDNAEKRGVTESVDYRLQKTKNAKWYNAKVSLVSGSGFIVVVRDITKWKDIIHHFEENEKKYQLLAENTTDIVVLYNPDGTISYISPSIQRLLGYTAESLTGIDPFFLLHPEDRAYIQEHFKPEYYPGDAEFFYEYRLKSAAGNWVYFDTIRKFLRDENGKVIHILACCRDITHKVIYGEALKKSEVNYKLLADNILDLVALHDLDGVFTYVSPSAFTVLGYTSDELIGKNAFDFIHPEVAKNLFEKNSAKAEQGTDTFIEEFRILHKDGHYVYFETTAKIIRDNENKAKRFLTTSRDISEWKKAQFAVKESEEKYKVLVENVDNLIIMVDRDCRYLFVNQTAVNFLKTPFNEIVGKRMGEVFKSSNASAWTEKIQAVFAENNPVRWETTVMVNNTEYWLRTGLNPVRNSKGEVYAVLLNAIDITNTKKTEALLEEQNKGLKEIAFLQSHVLRSPLSNIKHLISLLDKKSLSEENKILIDLLQVSANNLDDAVKHIVEKTYMPTDNKL